MPAYKPLAERLKAKSVRNPETGCLEWKGSTVKGGYGQIGNERGRKPPFLMVNRAAYEEWVGPIPEGMFVLHSCDNPPCIEPNHLFLGDHDANMADKAAKGRGRVPQSRSRTYLSHVQKLAIIEQLEDGKSINSLAFLYGVSRVTVRRIRDNAGEIKVAGDTDPRVWLTEQDVIDIRELADKGALHDRIAKFFGISRPHVTDIANRKARAKVKES
jgi:hypothetical protein